MEGTTAEARVAAAIRAAVLRGTLIPGQRLVELDMCERFVASRSAVRLAIRQLATEGLVDLRRNKGACVRAITRAEAADTVEARMTLEGLMAARAAAQIDHAQANALRALTADMGEALATGQLTRYVELSAQLRELIHDIAAHETARQLIETLHARTIRQPEVISLMGDRAATSLRELLLVVEAVTGSDPTEAEAATRRHLIGVVDALRISARERAAH